MEDVETSTKHAEEKIEEKYLSSPAIILTGATASGKTKLSIAMAKAINGEIINADSMQIWSGVETLSAAPTEEERDGIPHHLFSFLHPFTGEEATWDVRRWLSLVVPILEDVWSRGKVPIIVGGTLYYVLLLITGDEHATHREGNPTNPRLQRKPQGNELVFKPLRNVCIFHLACYDNDVLSHRVRERIHEMETHGLRAEVETQLIKAREWQPDVVSGTDPVTRAGALQAIGLKEFISWNDKNISWEEACEALACATERLARQQTKGVKRFLERGLHVYCIDTSLKGNDESELLKYSTKDESNIFKTAKWSTIENNSIEIVKDFIAHPHTQELVALPALTYIKCQCGVTVDSNSYPQHIHSARHKKILRGRRRKESFAKQSRNHDNPDNNINTDDVH